MAVKTERDIWLNDFQSAANPAGRHSFMLSQPTVNQGEIPSDVYLHVCQFLSSSVRTHPASLHDGQTQPLILPVLALYNVYAHTHICNACNQDVTSKHSTINISYRNICHHHALQILSQNHCSQTHNQSMKLLRDYFWFLFTQIIFPRITPGQAKGWPEKNVPGLLTQDFYRPDALPVTQPAVSKHWRETPRSAQTYKTSNCLWSTPAEAATVDQCWRWRDFVSLKLTRATLSAEPNPADLGSTAAVTHTHHQWHKGRHLDNHATVH